MKTIRSLAVALTVLLLTHLTGASMTMAQGTETPSTPAQLTETPSTPAKGGALDTAAEQSGSGLDVRSGDEAMEDGEFDEEPLIGIPDPLRPVNVLMYHFNDTVYFGLLRPLASAWEALVPERLRLGIQNFFYNLMGPTRMINCLLQDKGAAAEAEFVRFWMNSTVGILGFGNPAGKFPHLNPPEEDLGQTFGAYGLGEGFFIMWPLLGPSCLRDTVGSLGDKVFSPSFYLDDSDVTVSLSVVDLLNATSFRIGDYEAIKAAALDPYTAMRDAYTQFRRKMVLE